MIFSIELATCCIFPVVQPQKYNINNTTVVLIYSNYHKWDSSFKHDFCFIYVKLLIDANIIYYVSLLTIKQYMSLSVY